MPSTLYAGPVGFGVYKTTSGGTTWSASNDGLPSKSVVLSLAIDPAMPSTLYAGMYGVLANGWQPTGGVYRSADGGSTWSAASAGLPDCPVNALAIDPGTPSTLYAGTDCGIYRSFDAGGTWIVANTGLTNSRVLALAIDPTATNRLYAGTDGGGVFLGVVRPPIVGDCDESGSVTVDELVKGVNIALDGLPIDQCPAFDCNGNGRVSVDCLVQAVDAALTAADALTLSLPAPPAGRSRRCRSARPRAGRRSARRRCDGGAGRRSAPRS